MNQKVENYLKDFRQLTDEAYRYYTQDRGIKMGFVSSYLPRIYRNPANGQAISGQEYKLHNKALQDSEDEKLKHCTKMR